MYTWNINSIKNIIDFNVAEFIVKYVNYKLMFLKLNNVLSDFETINKIEMLFSIYFNQNKYITTLLVSKYNWATLIIYDRIYSSCQ